MNDLAEVQDRWATTRHPATEDEWSDTATGRHAFDEDAVLTPIFSALRRAGWPRRQRESAVTGRGQDPVDEFRRDPLTAPIPVQALVPAPSRSQERINVAAHAAPAYGAESSRDDGRSAAPRRLDRYSAALYSPDPYGADSYGSYGADPGEGRVDMADRGRHHLEPVSTSG